MILNLIAFLACAASCIYCGNKGLAKDSIICFVLAAGNLIACFISMYTGGRPA